ncbi:MAG: HAD family hydrolase [Halobacteria archaeon]|nr:HAD family hydrolase [Halobacteria archaeon]
MTLQKVFISDRPTNNQEIERNMFDYYIFDLDGVLVDVSRDYKREIFDEVGEHFGHEFTDEEIHNLWHGLGAESREDLLRSWGYEPREFWEVFDSIDTPERRLKNTFAYEDTSVLRRMDEKMGIVTHSPPDLAIPVLEKTGLEDLFESVVSCSYDIGYKPEPEPIRRCMNDLGVNGSKKSTIMIGDSVSDVKGAWNAGITAGHINRHGGNIDADYNLESLEEIP